jgi:hypothetical protein
MLTMYKVKIVLLKIDFWQPYRNRTFSATWLDQRWVLVTPGAANYGQLSYLAAFVADLLTIKTTYILTVLQHS